MRKVGVILVAIFVVGAVALVLLLVSAQPSLDALDGPIPRAELDAPAKKGGDR